MNITIFAPGQDWNRTVGMCGNNNGNASDDTAGSQPLISTAADLLSTQRMNGRLDLWHWSPSDAANASLSNNMPAAQPCTTTDTIVFPGFPPPRESQGATHTHTHTCVYIYICVCARACPCVRLYESVCVCVCCVCVCVCVIVEDRCVMRHPSSQASAHCNTASVATTTSRPVSQARQICAVSFSPLLLKEKQFLTSCHSQCTYGDLLLAHLKVPF
jgi:hypothetical protein